MKEKISSQKNGLDENIKRLVVARIEAQMSSNLRLSIGGEEGSLDKNNMIMHVQKGDDIGNQIVNAHINFIKAQASGKLISALNTV